MWNPESVRQKDWIKHLAALLTITAFSIGPLHRVAFAMTVLRRNSLSSITSTNGLTFEGLLRRVSILWTRMVRPTAFLSALLDRQQFIGWHELVR